MMLPTFDRPRILDIGCGSGLPTVELARLSGGEIVGIDTDDAALSQLRQRIEHADLSHRVKSISSPLDKTGFPDESFDILWNEGVWYWLDPSRSFPECKRLLKPRGFLVMHETVTWFAKVSARLPTFGFQQVDQHLLPQNCWWTDYGAPLEERIQALQSAHGGAVESAALARYKRDVATLKEAPDRFDCGFFLLQKRS